MADFEQKLPHKLTLDERKHLSLTGAKEVLHFDEDLVELGISGGTLTIQGSDLRLKCLSLDDGAVVIQGAITAISYDEPNRRRGLFH